MHQLSHARTYTHDAGYDGRLVHEASRAGVQVRQGLHDRDGVLGRRRAQEPAVPRAEGKVREVRRYADRRGEIETSPSRNLLQVWTTLSLL